MSLALSRLKNASTRRWLGVFLALAVFFLPLHFHLTSAIASQVTKECGCLHGTRTQLAMTAEVPQQCLPIELTAVVIETNSFISQRLTDPQKARGPPSFTSL
jgi:hypothetical protein